MVDRPRVAWVLGSGFSKSVGGPLLQDLLSHRGEAHVKAKFPDLSRTVYEVYRAHLKGDSDSRGNPIYWDHAEEFLGFLNTATAVGGKDRYSIFVNLLQDVDPSVAGTASSGDQDQLEPLRIDAARCLAAECLFTTHTSPRSEEWRPYFKWARHVGAQDTIITFNYDMVLEALGTHDKGLIFGAETVVSPSATGAPAHQSGARSVPILKLHGSVAWYSFGKNAFGTALTDTSAADQLRNGAIPFIAAPGPDKLLQQEGLLNSLWRRAVDTLKNADVIVFLGYRFPPSDSQSREILLGAIRENTRPMLRIHTVLGPRTNDDATVRLKTLLEHTLRGSGRIAIGEGYSSPPEPQFFTIATQPLYVEDFLTVVHDRELYGEATRGLVLTGVDASPLADVEQTTSRIEVLDTEPNLMVVYAGGAFGHPDRVEAQVRANDKAFTVWQSLEVHNKGAKPAHNVVVDFVIADARLVNEAGERFSRVTDKAAFETTNHVYVEHVDPAPGGVTIRQRIKQIAVGGSEKLVPMGIRPLDAGPGDETAAASAHFVLREEAGTSVEGQFRVELRIQGRTTLTLKEALGHD